jgi:hypothetical protein
MAAVRAVTVSAEANTAEAGAAMAGVAIPRRRFRVGRADNEAVAPPG